MKSKTIILSNIINQNSNSRGILTLYEEDDLLKCKLRLYSSPKLNVSCRLGIYHKQEVFTANLIEKNEQYESSFVGNFDMSQDFYCAIIDTSKNNQPILAGGTYAGYYFNDTSVFENTHSQAQNFEKEFDQVSKPMNCEDCNKCKNCKYKEFFYSTSQQTPKTPNPQIKCEEKHLPVANESASEKEAPKQTPAINTSWLDAITPQFKYIFENYPANEILNKKIDGGKFVNITENGEEYSLGAIYENEHLKYIAYAVKCNNSANPPKELGENFQWLPLDIMDPLSEGYFLVFQDTSDLKILEF